jgi:Flp pilus assembly protein TadD
LTVAERYYERGLDHFAKNRHELAIADLDEALLSDPQNAEYLVARGLMQLQHGWTDEAEDDFAEALELDPTQWLAHYGRAVRAFNDQEYAQAVNHFSRAQRIAPQRFEIYFYRAVAFHQMGNSGEATRDMAFAQHLLSPEDSRRKLAQQWLSVFQRAPA